MIRGSDVNNLPPCMFQNDETEQEPEADRGDDKHIDRSNAVGMVPQKGEASL